ncbi:cobaltochelatase subunit CobN [Allobranchiibius sp. GilTou38]|uniref:cobaltochelatase subunit CobN n=1 Tax=Allobranchiibius sp. GilTou38 TaxID=2815210 RepID=UPI001AA13406|nr:cobaltochelatase subunit CobN [Allobranchiibius sp. GilTou38]MBO1765320.1 cobaltochelatase subunit CobN [Allobranchiibius sp. GilTou38]
MPRVALLSTSDTDLLSARASGADYLFANPARSAHTEMGAAIEGADVIVARILGGPQDLCSGFRRFAETDVPMVVLGGEQTPNAALMECSRHVPAGIVAEAHRYLAQGGPANLANLHAFLSDTLLLSGEGFEPPLELPIWGVLDRAEPAPLERVRPRVGVLFYRAQQAAGNVTHIHALCDAIDAAGGIGVPIFATSLRDAPQDLLDHLGTLDTLVTTVLAAGGTRPAGAQAGGEDETWDVQALAALDIPIIQGLALTWSRADWAASSEGMSPLDVATQVAVPEFDGRLITVPFSFKEVDADGLPHYVADPERCDRVAGIAVNHGRLRHTPVGERKIALVLSAYPTKHSRIGNAVGLDTPVSTIRLLREMRAAGYDLGPRGAIPGLDDVEPIEGEALDTTAGNALVHALIAAGGQDPDWLTQEQIEGALVRIPASRYAEWFGRVPTDLQEAMEQHWGPAPGTLYVDKTTDPDGEIFSAAMVFGNLVILVQPPRGFGENPIAIYHDPDLPPTHHYLATYRWIEEEFGAHAVVHVGKHGNLEWLSGKNLAMSPSCGTDAALGNLPLIYPFLVNDPGEGTQAKRRAHATIVDHLIPPMARAEAYGDIERLEQLLDDYGNASVMDPPKAAALRGEIWTLIQAAKLDQDLQLTDRPDDESFDDFVMHIDGWLCEIKDVQIRDGLHVLGEAPSGEGLINLVLAVLRASQVFGGRDNGVPGLRASLGLVEGASSGETDRVEALAHELVRRLAESSWHAGSVDTIVNDLVGEPNPGASASLEFACREVVPRLAETTRELPMVLHALDGGYVPAGPSGSPLRGLVNVLPTGRNFYSVDPKAIPSRLAYGTGAAMADSLLARYQEESGEYPESVGLSVWGTSAMRTSGDDIGEVLALLGVLPVWDEASRRVVGLDPLSLAELGRPRIDVTVRISGFFRDAFPHVISMLDDAVQLVAGLDEPVESNFVRKHALADIEAHGDERRSRTRIFGSKPGAYGAGILQLVESGTWRDDADLAEVYTQWGGFAYGRGLDGVPARDDMERNYRRIQVAAKNIDNRESDILDSDDYFQYHGGMVAVVRSLTGSEPKAYVGDSTSPDSVRTRTLQEETNRIFRARVVNPRWISAMQRHGYKGAFELAATVDYLFGFDVTAGVVQDWMYETLAQEYVLDKTNRDFMQHANPWALRGIVEKLGEAADRGLWESPDPELVAAMQQVYLDVEGQLEE